MKKIKLMCAAAVFLAFVTATAGCGSKNEGIDQVKESLETDESTSETSEITEETTTEETEETQADNMPQDMGMEGDMGANSGPGGSGGPGGDMGPDSGGMGDMGGGPGGSGASSQIKAVQNGDYVSLYGQIGSFGGGDNGTGSDGNPSQEAGNDYLYTCAIAVADGDCDTYSNPSLLLSGTYDASSASDIKVNDSLSGHTAVLLSNAGSYSISNADITMETDADGSDTCDFSGVGSAIVAVGDTDLTISDSTIITAGVATMPLFTDGGAVVTMKNCTTVSAGGTIRGDYQNTAEQSVMVAPPWVLGIMGTSRGSNLMGTSSTLNVIDSDVSAGAWAVLSTDSGSNMYLNVFNSAMTLLNADESAAAPIQEETTSSGGQSQIYETLDNPYTENYGSGYGSYVIGNAVETFAGTEINVGTYAAIFTGGSATYKSVEKGETYTLKSADGGSDVSFTAKKSAHTVIHSDTFGFMVHQSSNTLNIEEGTEIESGFATFLVKSGSAGASVTASIDGAEIENGGVLIQVMDNDDSTTGNSGGNSFKTTHEENEGFYTGTTQSGGSSQNFTFTNGSYSGNIYNASGSDRSNSGPLSATTLDVTFGSGASYSGAIASTSAIHVTYEGSSAVKKQGGYAYTESTADKILKYQNTSFSITRYFDIGQVANMIHSNGGNKINVTLTDDALWTVTGESLIDSLTISGSAKVVVKSGCTLTVNGREYSSGTYGAGNF